MNDSHIVPFAIEIKSFLMLSLLPRTLWSWPLAQGQPWSHVPLVHSISQLFTIDWWCSISASSVVSSRGPSMAAREHEKRILESILPPDLRHLIGGAPSTWSSIQVGNGNSIFWPAIFSIYGPGSFSMIYHPFVATHLSCWQFCLVVQYWTGRYCVSQRM